MRAASKWDYVRKMSQRYQVACHKEKRIILDELEKNLGIHRKSAIRTLSTIKARKPAERRGRRRIYNDFIIKNDENMPITRDLCSQKGH